MQRERLKMTEEEGDRNIKKGREDVRQEKVRGNEERKKRDSRRVNEDRRETLRK